GVSLAGMDIAEVEKRSRVQHREKAPVARSDVADIEVAAPFTLAVQAGGDLAIGRHSQGDDEGSQRPRDAFVEVQGAVAVGAARAWSVAKDPGGVVGGQLGP